MNFQKYLIACGLALVCNGSLLAQTPIKSIDQAGNVTYSDRAATDAVSATEVQIDPGPSESQVEESEQRLQRTLDQADQAQAERDALAKKREAERQEAAAKKPETIVIQKEGGYPVYNPSLGSRPPAGIPPSTGAPQHPIYNPPGTKPPIAVPLPAPR